ncbi:MAG: protein kinase domain-containing protein [Vicinamibacteria bacterium]
MALPAHSRLGGYEVISPLGSGGMGEVYRARDTNLRRDVALKVLPEEFARDPERLARFEREAQILASLNHPNIGAIYGLERSDHVTYLVMELVPGETLGERMEAGPLAPRQSFNVFFQIAQALEAAHGQGIVHRDLKPENIQITPEQRVKVLDFGLAKAFAAAEPTPTAKTATAAFKATSHGVVMGTPAYMSPEQVRGQTVDRRTDIWSFGCCFYEALTKQHPFHRETASDVMAAVLGSEPDWNAFPPTTPPRIRTLVRRCLAKDSEQRLHDIADARIELGEAISAASGASSFGAEQVSRRSNPLLWALPAALVAFALGLAVRGLAPSGPTASREVQRFVLGLPTTMPVSFEAGPAVSFSPGGTRLVYAVRRGGTSQLYQRSLKELEPAPIPGTENGEAPFTSPDGEWLGFFAEGKLKVLPFSGGRPTSIADGPSPRGASWRRDGKIVFAPLTVGGLSIVSTTGDPIETLTQLDPTRDETSHRWPSFLPGGETLLFTSSTGGQHAIEALSLESGERKRLVENASYARYVQSGHLVFARDGSLMAAPFDLGRLELGGPAVTILENIMTDARTGAALFDVVDEGLMVYARGSEEPELPGGTGTLLSVDRQGAARSIVQLQRALQLPRLSPVDARRLLFTATEGDRTDVWSYQLDREATTRLTFEASNGAAIWTPDGSRITFSSDRLGPFNVFSKPSDGSGAATRLLASSNPQFPSSWSPDGRELLLTEIHPSTGLDVLLWVQGAQQPERLLTSPADESGAIFSPNGRFIAYVSNESGRDEVYVRVHPDGGKSLISADGGTEPVWSRNGRELFYRSGDWLMVVGIESEPPLVAGRPQFLFEAPYDEAGPTYSNYDTTPDGRFIMVRSGGDREADELVVITNWFLELESRVPSRTR